MAPPRPSDEIDLAGLPRLRVRTPENVFFSFEVAGLATRALAWAIDGVLMLLLIGLGLVAVAPFGLVLGPGPSILVPFAVLTGYAIAFEAFRGGQTPGKKLLRIQALSDDGLPVGFLQSCIRNFFRAADFLPFLYAAGGTVALLHPQGRRIGDVVAGTVVVRRQDPPDPEEIVAPGERYNTIQGDPGLAERLRRRMRPRDRETLVALCLRRNELDLDARAALFRRAAEILREEYALPSDARLSDERLVLNVTSVVVSRSGAGRTI